MREKVVQKVDFFVTKNVTKYVIYCPLIKIPQVTRVKTSQHQLVLLKQLKLVCFLQVRN